MLLVAVKICRNIDNKLVQHTSILCIIIMYNKRRYTMLNALNQLLGIAVKLMLVGVLFITGGIVDIIDFD